MRYKNVTSDPVWIRRLHITVDSGAEFDSDVEINGAQFQKVGAAPKKDAEGKD